MPTCNDALTTRYTIEVGEVRMWPGSIDFRRTESNRVTQLLATTHAHAAVNQTC